MKHRHVHHYLSLLIVGSLFMISKPLLAVQGDTEQPIHINSMQQSLDMPSEVATFTGSVVVTQGTIDIKADKVVVTRPQDGKGQEIIEAYGNPVTFYQMQDNGKPVQGRGQKLRYEVVNEYVVLTGDAYIEQLDSNVQGDKITYLVKQQKMEAFSDDGKRVNTVLLPAQLQNNSTPPSTQNKSK